MARGRLLQGDCLAVLPTLADGSVDMVFADLPYGITANPWDCAIPLDRLWVELRRVGKEACVFVFTATLRFAVTLVASQRALFRYDLAWHKNWPVGWLNANRMPMRQHELLLVFAPPCATYIPQKRAGEPYKARTAKQAKTPNYGQNKEVFPENTAGMMHPSSVLCFGRDKQKGRGHPTQKPVALLRWLIATYSRPGDLVLDPTSGVASTAVAALREGRRFVCIERDPGYFEKGCDRVRAELAQGELPLSG